MNIYDFFIRLSSRLVTKHWRINKNHKDRRFLFIHKRFVTKQLSRIKKSYIFIISVHCPTQWQVPPVRNSTFNFQTLMPKCTYLTYLVTAIGIFKVISIIKGLINELIPSLYLIKILIESGLHCTTYVGNALA